MKRSEIEAAYKVENGRIVSPGKFEGEPVWAPHFWEIGLIGGADADETDPDGREVWTFEVTEDDRREFVGLYNVKSIEMWESDTGFVYTKVTTGDT